MNGSLSTLRDEAEVERNLQAYRDAKGELDRAYPLKEFVAFAGGKLAAHSSDFEEVVAALQEAGHDPRQCVVVRVGDEDEGDADIFGIDRAAS